MATTSKVDKAHMCIHLFLHSLIQSINKYILIVNHKQNIVKKKKTHYVRCYERFTNI